MGLNVVIRGETEHPQSVVVVLHGSGQNAGDMAQAADIFSREIPGALILIPDGPKPLPGCNGFDWFTPEFTGSPQQLAFNLQPALAGLDELIDSQLKKHALTDGNLALFGFSLGGMTAMYEGLHRPSPCAVVICHSSIYPQQIEPNSKPPVVMVMGKKNIEGIEADIRDGKSPASFSYPLSVSRLQEQEIPVAEYLLPGLTHMMTAESLEKSARIVNGGLNGGQEIRAALLPVRQP